MGLSANPCLRSETWGTRTCARLAVFEPADDLGQVGTLAVHEDADAVDSRGNPEDEPDGEDELDDGDGYLKARCSADCDAHVHDEGRAEGEEREGFADESGGLGDYAVDDRGA